MKSLAFLALATATVSLAVAYAQTQPVQPVQPVAPSGGGSYDAGYPTYHHASTAAEGKLRGMSDMVRSHGQANLDNSSAAINYTVARRSQIDNRYHRATTYMNMRRANEAFRKEMRKPRPSMEAMVRFAQAGKPKRLSPSELNPVSGAINWPIVLRSKKLAANRAEVEMAFAQRASTSVVGAEEYFKIKNNTDEMLAELKSQIRQLPTDQYVIAKRFLQSLAYAAGRPAT